MNEDTVTRSGPGTCGQLLIGSRYRTQTCRRAPHPGDPWHEDQIVWYEHPAFPAGGNTAPVALPVSAPPDREELYDVVADHSTGGSTEVESIVDALILAGHIRPAASERAEALRVANAVLPTVAPDRDALADELYRASRSTDLALHYERSPYWYVLADRLLAAGMVRGQPTAEIETRVDELERALEDSGNFVLPGVGRYSPERLAALRHMAVTRSRAGALTQCVAKEDNRG